MNARIIAFPGCATPVQQPKRKGRPPKAVPSLSAAAMQREQLANLEEQTRVILGYIAAAEVVLAQGKTDLYRLQAMLNQSAPAVPGAVRRKG